MTPYISDFLCYGLDTLPPLTSPPPSPSLPASKMTYLRDGNQARVQPEHSDAMARYRSYQHTFSAWTSTVVRRLSEDALQDCAQRLGTANDGQLVGFAQQEWPVLLDFALYCHRLAGESAVQRLHAETIQVDGSVDGMLDAMTDTRVQVLDIEEAIAGMGFRAMDVWSGEPVEIMEPDHAGHLEAGDRLVCRAIPLADMTLTTGLLLPLSDAGLFRLVDELDASRVDPLGLSAPTAKDEYARVVYRCALDDRTKT